MTFRLPDEAALKELQDRLRKGGTVRRISMDDARRAGSVNPPGQSVDKSAGHPLMVAPPERLHRQLPGGGGKAFFAQGRLKPGEMNKGEAVYAAFLDREKAAGRVLWWKFEGIKLRLADNTFYTPDFAVLGADLVMECHEVKGFWMDDARAKVKIAADLYPFRFKALKTLSKKVGGGWEEEDFSRSGGDDGQPALDTPPAAEVA